MYTFNYEISENDYYEFNLYHSMNTPGIRKRIVLYRFIYPLFFMILATIIANSLRNYIASYAFFGVLSIVWVIFYKKICEYSLQKGIEKIKKDGKLPYSDKGTLIFNSEHIIDSSSVCETKIPYSSISKIAQNNSVFYLYYNVSQALIVPFVVFNDDKDKLEFLEYITQKASIKRPV